MDVFFDTFFNFQFMADHFQYVLDGFWVTIKLSLVGGICALVWGLILAVLRQLPGRALAPVRAVVIGYIDVFRGIPLLLVILLLSSGLATMATQGAIPREIGIPEWFGESDPFWYGVMALTLTYGAYMAEVYRAGIEAVPQGQTEAARSLGMSHGQAMRFVIIPQAVRKVIPPLLNDYIALMKDTALVSVIGLVEAVQAGRDLYSEFYVPSGYTLGAIFFLIVTIPLARVVDWQIKKQQEKFQRGMP
ncbi:MAG: amino acid ABC transporter permease [Solirubrobacterales bacterium]|nr:amino acid ABC transporter permease [Solirubrobacterales bacterium]HRV59768.1 amino acid ABC transporter permease [Solirubrobacterales bacterium]